MLRAIEGFGVLFLLSAFFAYMLAPLVAAVQRRVRLRPRQRPLSRAGALILIYIVLFLPTALAWRETSAGVAHWVRVTAPEAVDHLFGQRDSRALEAFVRRLPIPASMRQDAIARGKVAVAYIDRETHATLDDMIEAARQAIWLLAVPIVAFLLLTGAPIFQRSALRVLPRGGHLEWRAEEYLRDVNSALAGYIRAQTAAGLIVGTSCVAGFLAIGLASAVSTGVAAGLLEMVPAIGPFDGSVIGSDRAGPQVLAVRL